MSVEAAPGQERNDRAPKLGAGAVAWALFEGARNPYVILIVIYVFVPYVSAHVVGDPVQGQELVSRFAQYAGWIVMVTAPLLGAAVDQLGRRKGWLAAVVVTMCTLMSLLWLVEADSSSRIALITCMWILMALHVLFPYSEVLHNSLLVRAAGLRHAHQASGLALVLGNLFSVVTLVFTVWAFALPGRVDWWFIPDTPMFGLDPVAHEHQRIAGPLAAVIFALGAVPLFLFTPDAPRTGMPVRKAVTTGAYALWHMLKTIRSNGDAAAFLVSRMFYVDGMTAILLYYGVYAVGVMGWGTLELLINGILLSMLSVLGGFVARWMDIRIGPRRSVQISVGLTMVGLCGLLGMRPDKVLYLWPYNTGVAVPLWDGPVLRTLPDLVFTVIGCFSAVFITAQFASSRTLLTRLTPPSQTGVYFGLYALSGTATLWLGSFMVNRGTRLFDSQQGGFMTLGLLLALGFIGLFFVRGGGRDLPDEAELCQVHRNQHRISALKG